MELMMYLGNDLIESVTLNLKNISQPGYLGSFKRSLKQKHLELIQQSGSAPEFLVVNLFPAASAASNNASSNHSYNYSQVSA
jgi:hypothetical protein